MQVGEGELVGKAAKGRGPWAGWKGWVAIMALASIIVMGIWSVVQQSGEPRSSKDRDVQEFFDQQITSLCDKWRVKLVGDKPAHRRAEFFRWLSRSSCTGDDSQKHPHPDVIFWKRLKEPPDELPIEGDLLKPLHEQLTKLAGCVAIASCPSPVSKEHFTLDERRKQLPKLFEVIERGMDYRMWFAEQKWDQADFTSSTGACFPWDAESPPQVRKWVVDHFLPKEQTATGLRKEDVLTMVRQLNGWGVKGVQKEDAEDRPWFVCDCYLAFLSQSRFGAMPEESSWYVAFVARLPEKPAINMADRASKKDFAGDALLPLARGLGLEPSDVALTSTLLTDIADRLAYDGWRKERDDYIQRRAKKLEQELKNDSASYHKSDTFDVPPYGRVTIDIGRDGQGRPGEPEIRIKREEVKERSGNGAIDSFVERFRSHGTARKNEAPE